MRWSAHNYSAGREATNRSDSAPADTLPRQPPRHRTRHAKDPRPPRSPKHADDPPSYDFPFGLMSLLIPAVPPTFPILPVPRPPAPRREPPAPVASSPKTSKTKRAKADFIGGNAAAASERMGPKNPEDYDFPFGVRSLLIPTNSTPYGDRSRPNRASSPQRFYDMFSDAPPEPTSRDRALEPLPRYVESATQPLSLNHRQYRRVHVLCSNIRSSYIAMSLALTPKRQPVTLFMQKKEYWRREGGRIMLYRHGAWQWTRRVRPQVLAASGPDVDTSERIDQLIVTSRPSRTLGDLKLLAPRIDRHTVICLVQDGLGMSDFLNLELFTDPEERPIYVYGYMTHKLLTVKRSWEVGGRPGLRRGACLFTMLEEAEPGVMHLSAYLRDSPRHPNLGFHPPLQTHVHVQHFLDSMSRAPGLHVSRQSMGGFMALKLRSMVFQSVIDPIAVMLDSSYADLRQSVAGMRLVEQLLTEIQNVIQALPELSNENDAWFLNYVAAGKLRGDILGKLRSTNPEVESEMRIHIRNSRTTDIRFLTGWFVRRGREIGIPCPLAHMVESVVLAKAEMNLDAANRYIPLA